MEKLDHYAILKHLYQPPVNEVVKVEVPPMNYVMIDGAGDPNTSGAYQQALEALYSVSYTLKFLIKRSSLEVDYRVMPLEGLWWTDDMRLFSVENKSDWQWNMMIMQPPLVTPALVEEALAAARKKGLPAAEKVRFEPFNEGLCAQTMHIGPFSAEGPTIQRIHTFIQSQGELRGKHHEIYLSDIRKADPSRWKTVIRQPMTSQTADQGRPPISGFQ